MNSNEKESIRLSDRILSALELALEQGDIEIAEQLARAIDLAMTRSAGGGEFVERRDYPAEMEDALKKLAELREQEQAAND